MSRAVLGTSDVSTWYTFAYVVQNYGTFNIYPNVTYFNHPPFVAWLLKFIPLNPWWFPFLLRLLPILADFASIIVIWKLLTHYGNKDRFLICMLCCLNPINFLATGYHGNTDSIFMFLIFLAVYHFEKKNIVAGGVMYALSLCIKIVPFMLAPFIFFFLKRRDRIVLFLILLTMFFIVYLPYLIADHRSLILNIFQYSGSLATWGIGHLLNLGIANENIFMWFRTICAYLYATHIGLFTELFFILVFFLARSLMKQKKITLLEGCFLVFSLFLTLSPGFGIHYLSWLSSLALIVSPFLGVSYLLVGGILMVRVYTFWINCDLAGQIYIKCTDFTGPWYGYDATLDLVLWLLVAVMTIFFFIRLLYRDRRSHI
jgi:alpha-1,6-mannosyltransferase